MDQNDIRRLGIIYNPRAGGGTMRPIRSVNDYDQFIQRVRKAKMKHIDHQVKTTEYSTHADQIGRHMYYDGIREFVVIGGDGTIHEAVNGIMEAMRKDPAGRVKLGIVPRGTGNSFVRDLPQTDEANLWNAICEDRWHPCDVVKIRLDYGFLYSINLISIGFVAEVAKLRNKYFWPFGSMGYIMAVLSKLVTLSPKTYHYSFNGQDYSKPMTFLSINNSRFTGGSMKMAPDAKYDDKKFDVIEVGPMSPLRLLAAFPKIFSGKHISMPEVTASQSTLLQFDPLLEADLMIDGEVIRAKVEEISILPDLIYLFY
ncbi:MAG: YegS/Rv2252/BmrU family lipid kinase [Bdellovibrionota bacterium]